jgi:hypothetical protein
MGRRVCARAVRPGELDTAERQRGDQTGRRKDLPHAITSFVEGLATGYPTREELNITRGCERAH